MKKGEGHKYSLRSKTISSDSTEFLLLDLCGTITRKHFTPVFSSKREERSYRRGLHMITSKPLKVNKKFSKSNSTSSNYTKQTPTTEFSDNISKKRQHLFNSTKDTIKKRSITFYTEENTPIQFTLYREADLSFTKGECIPELKVVECDNDELSDDDQILHGKRQILGWMGDTIKEIQKTKGQILKDETKYGINFEKQKRKKK